MSRAAALRVSALLAFALALPAACGYPEFQFTTDAGTAVHRVPCGPKGDLCDAGEVCCFDKLAPPVDVCAAPGACPAAHSEFYCNDASFCSGGLLCCAQFGAGQFPDVIDCRQSCPVPKGHLTCETNADCATGTCKAMLDGYPGYLLCTP